MKNKSSKKQVAIDVVIDLEAIEQKIRFAKAMFGVKQAWFGSLVGRLKFKIITDEKKMPTCATDGNTIFFGAKYVEEATTEELIFVIGHEILHCLLNHFLRRTGSRQPRLWNVACDYTVNALLVEHKVGNMPAGALFKSSYEKMTSEEIYDILLQNIKENSKLNTLDDHDFIPGEGEEQNSDNTIEIDVGEEEEDSQSSDTDSGGDQEEKKEKVFEEWAKELKIATRRDTEENSKGLLRDLKELVRASQDVGESNLVDWKRVLADFIKSKFKQDISYMRPHRKTQSLGVCLPSQVNEEELQIAIALDTSGSIDLSQLKVFLAEVGQILSSYNSFVIHLWCFDDSIHNYEILTSDQVVDLGTYQLIGGGGTDYEENWLHMEKENIVPDMLLLLTDGQPGGGWGFEGVIDTIFAIVGDPDRQTVAPFGLTIHMDEDNQ